MRYFVGTQTSSLALESESPLFVLCVI